MHTRLASRCGVAVLAALVLVVGLVTAPVSFGDLNSQERSLQQGIGSDNNAISSYQGRLSDLRTRLAGIEYSLSVQQSLLARVQHDLRGARSRLVVLRAELARGRRVLARQLVA